MVSRFALRATARQARETRTTNREPANREPANGGPATYNEYPCLYSLVRY
jgi:hypothetical protein